MPATWDPEIVSVPKTLELFEGYDLESRLKYGHLMYFHTLNPWYDKITGQKENNDENKTPS